MLFGHEALWNIARIPDHDALDCSFAYVRFAPGRLHFLIDTPPTPKMLSRYCFLDQLI
jgi:hypothetical protein